MNDSGENWINRTLLGFRNKIPPIADAMNRNRFESTTATLHFEDPLYTGRTKKIKMIKEHFNSLAKRLYMEENLCIDEQIAYKGKKKFTQTI